MKQIFIPLKVAFWVAVAYLPLALDNVITDFMINSCEVGSECLDYSMPLIVKIGIVGFAARLLLWPLAAWQLGGRWIWLRFRSSNLSQPAPCSKNA